MVTILISWHDRCPSALARCIRSRSPSRPTITVVYESLSLPDGYWLEDDADILLLHRSNGSVVAAFSAMGADPNEIEREAREDTAQA
jgi:hypothetical protein